MHRKTMEHEESMEVAKELLDKGIGMGEIIENTNLSEEDIKKAKEKMHRSK